MKTETALIIGAVAVGAFILLSNKKVGESVGKSLGENVAGIPVGLFEGAGKAIVINPYETAKSYQHYIPILDDVAFWAANPSMAAKMSAYDYEKKILGWNI